MIQFNTYFDVLFVNKLSKSEENSQGISIQLNNTFFDNLGVIANTLNRNEEVKDSDKTKLYVSDFIICSDKKGWIYDQLFFESTLQNKELDVNMLNNSFVLSDDVNREILVLRKHKHLKPFNLIINGFELLIIELLSEQIQTIFNDKIWTMQEKANEIGQIFINIPESNIQIKLLKRAYASAQEQKNFIKTYKNWLEDKNSMYQDLNELLKIN
jgi:hypothetical protein